MAPTTSGSSPLGGCDVTECTTRSTLASSGTPWSRRSTTVFGDSSVTDTAVLGGPPTPSGIIAKPFCSAAAATILVHRSNGSPQSAHVAGPSSQSRTDVSVTGTVPRQLPQVVVDVNSYEAIAF